MNVLVLWLLVVTISSGLIWLLSLLLVPRGERIALLLLLVGLSSIAASSGIVGGLSREGAAGDIVAAALGLLGGVVVYLAGVDRSKGLTASLCAVVFSLTFVVAYFEAASRRGEPETYVFWRDQCTAKYTDKDILNDPATMMIMDQSIGRLCAEVFKLERTTLLGAASGGK